MKTKLTSLLLACGAVAASPLVSSAQDGRPQQETVKPAEPTARPHPEGDRRPDGDHKREGGRGSDGDRSKHDGDKRGGPREHADNRGEHREHPKAPESKPVTYLGLLTHGLSPELSAQVGLPEGFGLVVAGIMDGSPAKEAGFQKYDVLVLMGDQRIVNIEQFQALVRAQKKGDEVTLTIRRKGAEMKVSSKLGEHTFQAVAAHGHGPHPMMPPGARGECPGARSFHHKLPDPREHMEHMRGMMRERFENRGDGERGPRPSFPRPGFCPMNHGGDHKGPPSPPNGPNAMHRDGDHGNAGPQSNGPRLGPEAHRDGNRPDGDQGNIGPRGGAPQGNGPRPNAEAHRDGGRPQGEHGNAGPRAGGPPSNGPRPEGVRPEGEHGDRGPRAGGPPGNGPRPDGPVPDAPAPKA